MLLVLSLWTSYYLQIKRIRAVHETLVSIVAGMLVGFVVRLAPGHLIREMLVSVPRNILPDVCRRRVLDQAGTLRGRRVSMRRVTTFNELSAICSPNLQCYVAACAVDESYERIRSGAQDERGSPRTPDVGA